MGIIFICCKLSLLSKVNILDLSKLKAYADDKINVTEALKFVLGKVENIVGKGENAGYQHLLLFSQCFQKTFCTGSLIVGNLKILISLKIIHFYSQPVLSEWK